MPTSANEKRDNADEKVGKSGKRKHTFKGPATRNDFVNDIVDDARADAIFATLKTIVDDIVDDIVTCGRVLRRNECHDERHTKNIAPSSIFIIANVNFAPAN